MRILVTGATGNIGRMVVDHLTAAGGCTVRALTVDPLRAALPVDEVVALAKAAGVGHVVDLSGEPEGWWGSVALARRGGRDPVDAPVALGLHGEH